MNLFFEPKYKCRGASGKTFFFPRDGLIFLSATVSYKISVKF